MDKRDLPLGLAWVLLGVWTLASNAPVLLGVGLIILGALYLLSAMSPKANNFLSSPVLRRK